MSTGLVQHPGAGCVVEFMQGNMPQAAWVLEAQGEKLRLLLPNRREQNIQVSRLLPWSGPQKTPEQSRDAALHELERHIAKRAELLATLDPQEWWSLAQGEIARAPAKWFADLAGDSSDADLVAACGHALLACRTHFKFQPPQFDVLSSEQVEKRLEEQSREAERERLLKQGVAFLRALWDTFLKRGAPPDEKSLSVLDEHTLSTLREMLLKRIGEQEGSDETSWRQLTKTLPDDPHLALHLAQAWGIVGPHHNIWLDRAGYDVGDTWTQAHAQAIDTLHAEAARVPQDISPLPFVSIDSATTRDIDDAFHIASRPEGGWNLTLALACPAHNWPFDSELDKAVRCRATSLYLPEGISNMLPESLGNGCYSLFAGETRPALLVQCAISAEGQVLSCTPSVGHVRLAANLSYEQCEAALDGESNEASPFIEQLQLGAELSVARQAQRIEAGAVIINRPELGIVLEGDLNSHELSVKLVSETPSVRAHLLVAEQMIVANAGLAAWADAQNASLLFRTQDVSVPKEAAGIWTEPLDIARVVKFLAPACVETTPRPHVGVGEAKYAPITSPLRRYPDLVNEAQIISLLQNGVPRWSKAELDAMLLLLNTRLDAAGMVQRSRFRYWKLLAIRKQGDVWRRGIITDENDAFLTVNLSQEQLLVRGRRVLFPVDITPGQALEVRLGRINPLLGDVTLLETRPVSAL